MGSYQNRSSIFYIINKWVNSMLTCLTHNDDVGYNFLCWLNQRFNQRKKNDSLRILLNRGSRSNLHMPLNAIKGLFGFLKTITHHFSLNFYHSSLKIPKFSRPHPFGKLFSLHITQIFQLFVGPIAKHLVRASLVSWFFLWV